MFKKLLKGLALAFVFVGASFLLTGCQNSEQVKNNNIDKQNNGNSLNNPNVDQVKEQNNNQNTQEQNDSNEDQQLIKVLDELDKDEE